MTRRPFRFVHAADLRLDEPLHGFSRVADNLRALCAEAPYRAAEKVFDLAIAEAADFVILTGDLVEPDRSGPRGPLFLVSQFNRLRERGIQVYWAAGRVPIDAWPEFAPLPANVHAFSSSHMDEHVHERDGRALARLVGQSGRRRNKPRVFNIEASDEELFCIAVANGAVESSPTSGGAIDYFALGGADEREGDVVRLRSPQGRTPAHEGPHGCACVHVDQNGRARVRRMPTDAVRFQTETIVAKVDGSREQIERAFNDRLLALAADHRDTPLLVSWRLEGPPTALARVRHGNWAEDFLSALRRPFGVDPALVWSLSLEIDSEAPVATGAFGDNTLLADLLRMAGEASNSKAAPIELTSYLDRQFAAGEIADAVSLQDPGVRRRVMRDVAALGVELLAREERAL